MRAVFTALHKLPHFVTVKAIFNISCFRTDIFVYLPKQGGRPRGLPPCVCITHENASQNGKNGSNVLPKSITSILKCTTCISKYITSNRKHPYHIPRKDCPKCCRRLNTLNFNRIPISLRNYSASFSEALTGT